MKKYLAALLCLSMVLSSLTVFTGIGAADAEALTVLEAEKILSGDDAAAFATDLVANPISEKKWGQPTITVNGDSYNTAIYSHNDTPDVEEASFYFRWDDTYLYIGMTSPDPYFLGSDGGSYEGDGIQFLIEPRVTAVTGDKFNISINQKLNGEVKFSEHSGKWSEEQKDQVIRNVIYDEDVEGSNAGTVNVMLAIPHSLLGLEEAEVKAGAYYACSILRVSGNASGQCYAGWMSWGCGFAPGHAYNPGCVGDNVIVLSDSMSKVEAKKWVGTVDASALVSEPITSKNWGEPTITVNGDSYNTAIYAHNDTPDVEEASFYLRWDETYLYIGMTSPDPYFLGSDGGSYEGDGIQFLIEPRVEAVTGDKFNISINQKLNGEVKFSEHSGKWSEEQKAQVVRNVIYDEDVEGSNAGTVNVMLAIPHTLLGLEEAEIAAGTIYALSILRVSGNSSGQCYAGWMSWGCGFAPGHAYNPGCVSDNVVVLGDSTTTYAAEKLMINGGVEDLFANPISAKGWGQPTVTVNGDSYNTAIYAHNDTPDVEEASFYLRWDETYLYIGMTSPDPYFLGSDGGSYEGDGIQFLIEPRVEAVTGDKFNISINQKLNGEVKFSEHSGKWSEEQKAQVVRNVIYDEGVEGSNAGTVNVMLAIPHTLLGLEEAEIAAGTIYALSILRVSGNSSGQCYAGWMSWGCGFAPGHAYNPGCVGDNVVVLTDENLATGESTSSLLTNMSTATKFTPAEGGLNNGNKILKTANGSYMVYVERENIVAAKSGWGEAVLNQFSLHQLDEANAAATALGYGYVWRGDIDAMADAAGNVYVMGGWTNHNEYAQLNGHVEMAEKVILAAYVYDENAGLLVNHGAIRAVEEGYSNIKYVTSTIDSETGKIYSVYSSQTAEGYALEYFTFDTATKTWDDGSVKVEVEAVPETGYAYFAGNGLEMFYEADGVIYQIKNDSAEVMAEGALKDVYADSDDKVHVLYTAEGQDTMQYVTLDSGFSAAVATEIPAAYQAVMTEYEGKVYVLTMDNEKAATALVYTVDGTAVTEAYEVVLDEIVRPNGQLMVARRTNGSVESDNLLVMLSGKTGPVKAWYYAVIPTSSTEDEE